jgi:hypothetical protein
MSLDTNRRGWLKAGGAALGGLWLAACDKVGMNPKALAVVSSAEARAGRRSASGRARGSGRCSTRPG